MRANKSRSLFFLLLAVTLAGACGANRAWEGVGANSSQGAAGNAKGNRAGGSQTAYSDPDGAFAIKIPSGWKVEREEKDGTYMTVIVHEQYRAANLSIMTVKGAPPKTAPADVQSRMLTEGSEPFFEGWMNGLREQARVEGTGDVYPTLFDNLRALRTDVTYYRGDKDDPRQAYSVLLSGDKTTLFISVTSSRSRFDELEGIVSTMRIEP